MSTSSNTGERRRFARPPTQQRWPPGSPEAERLLNAREETELREPIDILRLNITRLSEQLEHPVGLRSRDAPALRQQVRELQAFPPVLRGVHAAEITGLTQDAVALADRVQRALDRFQRQAPRHRQSERSQ